ncbi:MAG TPA: hypothetical protein VF202_00520 [Trueperaceae bacterium]
MPLDPEVRSHLAAREAHCVPGGIHGGFTDGEDWSSGERLWDPTLDWLAARLGAGPSA